MAKYRESSNGGESTDTYIHLHAISPPPTPFISILNPLALKVFPTGSKREIDIKGKGPFRFRNPKGSRESRECPHYGLRKAPRFPVRRPGAPRWLPRGVGPPTTVLPRRLELVPFWGKPLAELPAEAPRAICLPLLSSLGKSLFFHL